MSSLYTIRFPDGESEYRYLGGSPTAGAFVLCRSSEWVIREVDEERRVCQVAAVETGSPVESAELPAFARAT